MPAGHESLTIVPDSVRTVGETAYRMAGELRAGAGALDQEVTTLMTSWRGAAADSYLAAWTEMHQAAVRIYDELFEIAEKLRVVAGTTQEHDQTTARDYASLDLED
ncbi:WXG100 family type VII secretion target [Nocardia farcinica]|nr:WXG100 family type VII secretion target [Nocardia farcinica]